MALCVVLCKYVYIILIYACMVELLVMEIGKTMESNVVAGMHWEERDFSTSLTIYIYYMVKCHKDTIVCRYLI